VSSISSQETEAQYVDDNTSVRHAMGVPAYPRARIPNQAVLSPGSFRRGGSKHIPSILDASSVEYASSGRIAIALALRQMKIGPGDKVLVPAYHCSSMIEPIIWVGATLIFYKVLPDTSIDLEDVQSKVDSSTKVLCAVNYFGFPQPLSKIRTFCDERNLFFLEDCAHCFFGSHEGRPVGSFGDYAIASSTKFFPTYDGGFLVSSRHGTKDIQLRSAGPSFELKASINTLERSFEYGRMGVLNALLRIPLLLKNLLWGRIKEFTPANKVPQVHADAAADGGFGFDPKWIEKTASFFSRRIVTHSSRPYIANKRRENYMKLHSELCRLPGSRPLFPDLPEAVVPWVFPLIVDVPEQVFPLMKQAGVPITRFGEFLWAGVDDNVCPVSVDLSRRVMQFPVHQELLDNEITWMVEKIKTALLSNGRSTQ
jgi:perosamine synthetase